MNDHTAMQAYYFGGPDAARFAVYHPPRPPCRDLGVLLCYPLGHEYIRAHRAYRSLALALSKKGFPVLRFDYVGTGDSPGDDADVSVSGWRSDVQHAMDELKRRSGVARLSVIGLRLGATFAVLGAASRRDVGALVLWDPVLSGRAYLQELAVVEAAWRRDRLGGRQPSATERFELIGFSSNEAMQRELDVLDVREIHLPTASRISFVVSTERDDCQAWARTLSGSGTTVTYEHVPSAGNWVDPDTVHQLLLPHEILRAITARVSALPVD